eukprot:1192124-Prorocentrum_minimum.AAC.3
MIGVPPRYLARSAPPGSLQHIHSRHSQDNLSGHSREQYYLSGQGGGVLGDSDGEDDDYDAYAGEVSCVTRTLKN